MLDYTMKLIIGLSLGALCILVGTASADITPVGPPGSGSDCTPTHNGDCFACMTWSDSTTCYWTKCTSSSNTQISKTCRYNSGQNTCSQTGTTTVDCGGAPTVCKQWSSTRDADGNCSKPAGACNTGGTKVGGTITIATCF